jgi:hypothetical protein
MQRDQIIASFAGKSVRPTSISPSWSASYPRNNWSKLYRRRLAIGARAAEHGPGSEMLGRGVELLATYRHQQKWDTDSRSLGGGDDAPPYTPTSRILTADVSSTGADTEGKYEIEKKRRCKPVHHKKVG